MSATTAGWVLIGENETERVRRAAVAVSEAMRYELGYTENAARIHGARVEERSEWTRQRVDALHQWARRSGVELKAGGGVKMTEAVRLVALAVDDEPRISAYWNYLSSGAHGLGWHISTRTFGAGTQPIEGTASVAFPAALDLGEFVGIFADVARYVERVLVLAERFSSDPGELVKRGELVVDFAGVLQLNIDLT